MNRSNNEPDTSTRNLNIKNESLNIIERGDEIITPSQLIDPPDLITANLINPTIESQLIDPPDLITANLINPTIEGGHSFHFSLVNNGFNEAHSQKYLGIKEHFYQDSDSNHS